MRTRSLFLVSLFLTLLVGGLFYAQTRGRLNFGKKTIVAAATPTPTPAPATPAPATPAPVVEVVKAPDPVPEKPVPPTPEQTVQARIDAAHAIGGVRAQMARGEFAGAARALDEWLAGNGTHLQAAAIQAQAERLRTATDVVPAMLTQPAALTGATIRAGNAVWTVMGVAEGRLKCQTKSQFGVVERPVEAATLPEAALVPLLKQADAAGQTTLAATYLLGLGKGAEARAAIPAAAPQNALLAGVAEWEKLAGDHAVVVALDGVGTLVSRGEFAAASQRLEQSKKLYGGHDFFSTAYAAKIEDWTKQISSAPPTTPMPVAVVTSAASGLRPSPPGSNAVAALPPGPALPAGALDAARTALLEGVTVAPRIGQQGPVAIYGAAAFPVLTVSDDKGTDVVGAAGLSGKGRALIFGHSGYIGGGAQTDGDLGKLMVNAVKWCGNKAKPRIGVSGCDIDKFLDGQGFRAQKFSGPLKKSVLHDFDVVIMSVGGLNDDEEATALKDYIEGGGGVIAAMTGWAFPQYSKGREFYATNRANYALAGAGIAFTDNSIFGGGSNLTAQREPAPMLNAYTAIEALQKRFGAAPPPSLAARVAPSTPAPAAAAPGNADLDLGGKSVQLALEAMPPASKAPFMQVLASLVSSGKPIVPSNEAPLTEGIDNDTRTRATLQARLLKTLPAAALTAHPAAANFPGRVPAQSKSVVKAVRIDPTIPAWHSTGLYTDAGAPITVKLPPEAVAGGYQVRIGCHTDGIYPREKWPRIPEITRQFSLSAAETVANCAFGGLVYIVVPDSAKSDKPFEATVSGAFEAPYFVLGETTDAQWKEMPKRPAPWAEFASKSMILSVPSDVARDVKNPTEVMQYWERATTAQDDLSDVKRKRPERMVSDISISAGFMHSGYPIMLFLPQAKEMVAVSKDKTPGWGFHHEIGHNHQRGEWTFDGTGEVTNNIFAIYVTEVIDGVKRGENHGAIKPDGQTKKWGRYRAMKTPYTEWKGDPFLALGTFIKLIDEFGWDPMKKFFRSYEDTAMGPKPKTDEEERDQWMVRYSKIIGKNLGPYFDACGIPVSSSAKTEISKLPEWMPPGFK